MHLDLSHLYLIKKFNAIGTWIIVLITRWYSKQCTTFWCFYSMEEKIVFYRHKNAMIYRNTLIDYLFCLFLCLFIYNRQRFEIYFLWKWINKNKIRTTIHLIGFNQLPHSLQDLRQYSAVVESEHINFRAEGFLQSSTLSLTHASPLEVTKNMKLISIDSLRFLQ